MTFGQSLVAHWYYRLPDLLLLVLSGLLALRLVASLISRSEPANGAWRVLWHVTTPIYRPVAAITPRIVPVPLVVLVAIIWLMLLRMALFVGVSATGARLSMAG